MAPLFRSSGRRRNNKPSCQSYRKILWFRPRLEWLEDRTLLSAAEASPTAVLSIYQGNDSGISVLNGQTTAIVNQALGLTIPLVNQTIGSTLGNAVVNIQTPFQTQLTASELTGSSPLPAGFSFVQGSNGPEKAVVDPTTGNWIPYADGDYFEVNYTNSWSIPANLVVAGTSGFSYLDNAGGLFGAINGTATVAFTVTMGVDGTGGAPSFFVLASNAGTSTVPGTSLTATFTAATDPSNPLTGSLNIANGLANVTASATANLNVSATGNFQATSSDTNGKIRLADFQNSLSSVITGSFDPSSSASLNANFDASLLGADIQWTGSGSYSLGSNNTSWTPSFSLNTSSFPNAQTLLSDLGGEFFSLGDEIPILGPLASELNQPLPIINQSIAQLTGLELPDLPSLPADFSGFDGSYSVAGGTLMVNVTPQSIGDLLNGDNVDLLSWTTGQQNVQLANFSETFPIASIVIVTIAATIDVNASLTYDLGFGVDNHGFYLDTGTPSDPLFGLSAEISGGLDAEVGLGTFLSAGVGGGIGFSANAYVTLAAPPWASDPSKVYLSDLALFGSNPISDIFDDIRAGIQGNLNLNVYAIENVLWFTFQQTLVQLSIPVFNFETNPSWPAQPGAGGTASSWPVSQNGGVLTFNGTANGDNLSLSEPSPGQVTIDWAGVGSKTYSGVTQFVFNGSNTSSNSTNRLTTASGFDISIEANGGSGNDYFEGGAANDTLTGGSGKDTLVAGTGNDSITGGSGDDMILGGSGNDTLTAGSGSDTIYGGSGNSTLQGGTGNASLYAGSGNDSINGGSGTDYIDGGTGSDTIQAGSGLNDSIYGGSGGHNLIYGSSVGHDLIYGGGPNDTIHGGAGGFDTIYGGSGGSGSSGSNSNNQIYGGAGGNNSIYGGGGGDTLYAGIGGNNTLYGGTGAETLYGGDGQEVGNGPGQDIHGGDGKSPGNNLLVGGSGNEVIYGDSNSTGHNTLQAGSGNDTLYAGNGGDTLQAGSGTDALYGGGGNDTLVLTYLPTLPGGQSQSPDTLVGGPGMNTLVISPVNSVANPGPGILTAAITDAPPSGTTENITVSDGANITNAELAQKGGYVIQIDNEQMLVTDVSKNTITVERGYNGTTTADHGVNALILPVSAPPPPLDYKIDLAPVAGASGQYQATLSNKDTGAALGQVTFSLPVETTNLELMGGSGNNWIQVDPAVTQDVLLYGGPGHNTLMAGSGNDTLVAGSGSSVLYGGSGDDVLYGGDLPGQDNPSAMLSSGEQLTPGSGVMQESGMVSNGSSTIQGLASTSQLAVGQLVVGEGIPSGTTIAAIDSSAGTITVSNVVSVVNQEATTINEPLFFGSEGSDTLIAGTGNDELFAGSGNDVLIGGSVQQLSNGNYALTAGAGRDILQGGSGDDLLIAGPGSPGEILTAGSGNDTLVAANSGDNVLQGGVGEDLLLGGNGNDVLISGSLASGSNTLVGGLGLDTLLAAAGNDVLYAYPETTAWTQAEQAAAADHVTLTPPGTTVAGESQLEGNIATLLNLQQTQQGGLVNDPNNPNDPNSIQTLGADLDSELATLGGTNSPLTGDQLADQLQPQNLPSYGSPQMSALVSSLDQVPVIHEELVGILSTLQDTQGAGLPAPQQDLLQALLADEATQLFDQDSTLEAQMAPLQEIPQSQRTSSQQAQLVFLTNEDNQILQERIIVQGDLAGTLADSLVGCSGSDQIYGSPYFSSYLGGGTGSDTFYNYHQGDTVQGGNGGTNTLMIQGDGTIDLQPDSQNSNAIDVSIGAQQSGSITSGSDTITGLADTSQLMVGESVTDADGYIPQGATIVSIDSATQITISSAATGSADESLTFTATASPLVVGNVGTISNIQILGVQTGNGNDTVNADLTTLPAGLTGLLVQCGSGNDVIDASSLTNSATLLGGSGNDTIKIGTQLPPNSVYNGGTGQSELDIVGSNNGMVVTVANGQLSVGGEPENVSNFSKIVAIGGSGSNTFTTDGSTIENSNGTPASLMLEGGTGPNQFSTKDGDATGTFDLIGGTGANTFILAAATLADNGIVTGGTGANALQIQCDNNGDMVNLSQSGDKISIGYGLTNNGIPIVYVLQTTATNMDSVSVQGGSGNDDLDAGGLLIPVTLNGNGGNDTLIGGTGNNLLYYDGSGSSYDGGRGSQVYYGNGDSSEYEAGGTDNTLYFPGSIPSTIGNVENIQNYSYVNNNGSRVTAPVNSPAITVTAINAQISNNNFAIPTLTISFTDTSSNANSYPNGYLAASINWGDGTTTAGNITETGPNTFSIVNNHIYATNGSYTITVAITDSDGAYANSSTSFSGGLDLVDGDLRLYTGNSPTSYVILDSGVQSFLVRNADSSLLFSSPVLPFGFTGTGGQTVTPDVSLFVLFTNGTTNDNLIRVDSSSTYSLGSDIQNILLGPNDTLYALDGSGNLYVDSPYGTFQLANTGVQSILMTSSGNLYRLDSDGSLYELESDDSLITFNWVLVQQGGVRSISLDPNGSSIDVIDFDGDYWQYDGLSWTLLSGPHFELSVANSNVIAGQPIAVTLTVLDALGELATGYTGTVQFTSSDVTAGPLPAYTFTPADDGSYTFLVTLSTSDDQTITAADTAGSLLATTTLLPTSTGDFAVDTLLSTNNNGINLCSVTEADNVAVVGIASADNNTGAVYVFTQSNGVWTQQATLTGNGAVGDGLFGSSLSLSSDGNTLVVGAPDDDNGVGAAYVFTQSNGVWTQQAKLVGLGEVGDGAFGGAFVNSVSLSSDGNTLVVGASDDNNAMGAAYVFTRSNGVWTQQAKLVGTGEVGDGLFGSSVSLSSDGNTLVVGASDDDNGVGAAYVFTQSNGVWTQQDKLVGLGEVGEGDFGAAVTLSSDGITLVVGAPGDDPGGSVTLGGSPIVNGSIGVGAAYVFTQSNGVWTQQAKLVGTGALGDGEQGSSVLLSSDGNTLVVGAPDDDNGVGAAYVFTQSNGVWTQQTKLTIPSAGALDGSIVLPSPDNQTLFLAASDAVYVLTPAQVAASSTEATVTVSSSATSSLGIAISTDNSAVIGSPLAITVTAYDTFGNVDTGYTGTIHFSSSDAAAGLPSSYTFTSADAGVHTFYVTFNTPGNQSITVTDTGNDLSFTSTPVVVAGPAAQLVVTLQPPAAVNAGQSFGLTVSAVDAQGNVSSTFDGPVTLSLANNPGDGTLGGTLTVNAVNGVATFSGLTLDAAGTGYTLQAASNGLTAATTGDFTVAAMPATQLMLTTPPPGTVTPGQSFGLVVSAEDGFGNVDPTFNGTVTLLLKNNPDSASLGGTLTVTASNGVATFSGLTLNQIGSGYTLQAISTGLTAATTGPINVATAPIITTQPSSQTVTAGQTATFTASASGSPTPTVQWQVSTNGGASFTDISGATSATLTLSNVQAAQNGDEYQAVFTNSTGSAITNAVTLTVQAAPTITSGNSTIITIGQSANFIVTATGSPTPTLTIAGALPSGVSFTDNGNGTGTLGGTPTAGTNGTYHVTITAHNATGNDATQSFTLTVNSLSVLPPPPPSLPTPPLPSSLPTPAAPNVPSLLAFFNNFLGGIKTVNANGTTITESLFGFPLVETYDFSGSLVSVTLFGINITFLFG